MADDPRPNGYVEYTRKDLDRDARSVRCRGDRMEGWVLRLPRVGEGGHPHLWVTLVDARGNRFYENVAI